MAITLGSLTFAPEQSHIWEYYQYFLPIILSGVIVAFFIPSNTPNEETEYDAEQNDQRHLEFLNLRKKNIPHELTKFLELYERGQTEAALAGLKDLERQVNLYPQAFRNEKTQTEYLGQIQTALEKIETSLQNLTNIRIENLKQLLEDGEIDAAKQFLASFDATKKSLPQYYNQVEQVFSSHLRAISILETLQEEITAQNFYKAYSKLTQSRQTIQKWKEQELLGPNMLRELHQLSERIETQYTSELSSLKNESKSILKQIQMYNFAEARKTSMAYRKKCQEYHLEEEKKGIDQLLASLSTLQLFHEAGEEVKFSNLIVQLEKDFPL